MRVIFIGPTGAGKGTQCALLAARLGIPHISTGDIFRRVAAQRTPVGQHLADLMRAGELVPDDLAIRMLRHRLSDPDCEHGFLLDGFPRTYTQAMGLGRAMIEDGVRVDSVVLLELPDEEIIQRVTGRRMDPETGKIYHVASDPPPEDVASRLVRRDDDTEEACRAMLRSFHTETPDLVELYEDRDLLVRIDATGAREDVQSRVRAALGVS